MLTEKNTVLKIVAAKPECDAVATVEAKEKIKSISWCVKNASGEVEIEGNGDYDGTRAEISFKFDAKPWSVEKPIVYTLFVNISYQNGETEQIFDGFGYRYFSVDEKYMYLNGFPFYMRAYIRGAAAHEHQNNCALSEYEFYKKNILMAKSYGYNTIRFHSVVPPEACFRAADENGILIHIEMRAEHMDYDNVVEMLYGKNKFVTDEELIEIINRLYNHPSFMVYCVGNEIRQPGKKPRIREIRDFIKKNDPTRLFIDTCAHGEFDRDYVDFDVQHMGYFFPYGEHADMFENTDNLLCFGTVKDREMVIDGGEEGIIRRAISFNRPLVAHEVCHYVSWRDFYALKEKFERYGKEAPWWVNEEIKMIEAKGYKDNFAESLQITKDFQFRCWKTALESLRSSPLLSGFHMLQFADTDKYENSNGVVDCFDDPHGISAEAFRAFNADTVLLARLPKQVFTMGERVKIPVLLSQYMIDPPKSAEFSYKLSLGEKELLSAKMPDADTGASGLYKICGIDVVLPTLDKAEKLTLTCRLDFVDGSSAVNSWELWVFPKFDTPLYLDAKLDMNGRYFDRAITENKTSPLTVTDKLDDELFERLSRGEDVMLIYRTVWTRHLLNKGMQAPKYSFRHVWERFKGVIWDRGTINGGPDEKELLNKHGFVTDGQINFQYYSIIDDCDKINLDTLPVKAFSLVSGLDKCNRDRFDATKFRLPELMYDRTMRHFSYAFEIRVGKGRLLVAGFNFTGAEKADPAALSMLSTLVSYCRSDDFGRGGEISVADLKAYLSDVAANGPQKEGMMTQYWQLDAEPVESVAYWQESERYLTEEPTRDTVFDK